MIGRLTTLTILLVASPFSRVAAHDLPISNMIIVADEDFLHVELTMNSAGLVFYRELDRDNNGRLEISEVREQGEEIAGRILDCLTIEIDGRRLDADNFGIVPDVSTHHLTVRAHYAADGREVPLSIASRLSSITNGAHTTQVTFRKPGSSELARLNARSPQVLFNGSLQAIPTGAVVLPEAPSSETNRAKWFLVGVPVGVATLIGCLLLFKSKNK